MLETVHKRQANRAAAAAADNLPLQHALHEALSCKAHAAGPACGSVVLRNRSTALPGTLPANTKPYSNEVPSQQTHQKVDRHQHELCP